MVICSCIDIFLFSKPVPSRNHNCDPRLLRNACEPANSSILCSSSHTTDQSVTGVGETRGVPAHSIPQGDLPHLSVLFIYSHEAPSFV